MHADWGQPYSKGDMMMPTPNIMTPTPWMLNDSSIPNGPFWDHYPNVIYDDNNDFHHHHHDHDIFTTTTTTTTPPPPPIMSKPMYAHYQLRQKFWYINIYFALWFVLYCTWLMVKSVGRYKVS